MAESSDIQGILRQNLVDAGCGQEIVERCMDLAQQKRTREMKHILACHRRFWIRFMRMKSGLTAWTTLFSQ